MFKLDDNLLRELGLGTLPATEKNRMLTHIYETLEMRVGMKLAQRMTNEQLDEFEAFIDRSDEAGALKWLEANFPNYKQVVAEELETLKAEIKVDAPQIVAASQQAQVAGPVQQEPLQPTVQPAPQQFIQQPDQFSQPQPAPQFDTPQQPVQPSQATDPGLNSMSSPAPQPYQGQFPAPPTVPGPYQQNENTNFGQNSQVPGQVPPQYPPVV